MEPLKDFVRQMPVSDEIVKRKHRKSFLQLDFILLFLLLCLVGVGLIVLYSASNQSMSTMYRQGVYLMIGFLAMLIVSKIPINLIRFSAPIVYCGTCVLLLAVLLFGVGAKGAQRWIDLGIIRFQPSEFMKLATPLFTAWYLSQQRLPPSFKTIVVVLLIVGLPAGLVVVQPDLGTSILVASAGLFVLWLSGLGLGYIVGAISVLLLSAYPLWTFFLRDYQKQRIMTLFNPEDDRLGAGWNIIQSKTAIGSGGVHGKGWLQGTQSHLDFLPESNTDFIIAVLAEEYGLIGVLILLILYFLILLRGLYVSWRSSSVFGQLLGGAITLTFFMYVMVNMGMVSGVLPIVGVPLPLVSQGGTSIVSLLVGFGILMVVASNRRSDLKEN